MFNKIQKLSQVASKYAVKGILLFVLQHTLLQHQVKHIILSVIVSEAKFIDISLHIFYADMMVIP